MRLSQHAEKRLVERYGIKDFFGVEDAVKVAEPVKIHKDGKHIRRIVFEGHEIDAVLSQRRDLILTVMHPKKYEPLDDAVKEYWR